MATPEQFRKLSWRLADAQERERTRVARQMHDDLGQTLTVLKMNCAWLVEKSGKEPEAAAEKLKAHYPALKIAGVSSPWVSAEPTDAELASIAGRLLSDDEARMRDYCCEYHQHEVARHCIGEHPSHDESDAQHDLEIEQTGERRRERTRDGEGAASRDAVRER